MKQIISLSIVSIAFHTAEMRRMNRALVDFPLNLIFSRESVNDSIILATKIERYWLSFGNILHVCRGQKVLFLHDVGVA